jgi:hypothetical protein
VTTAIAPVEETSGKPQTAMLWLMALPMLVLMGIGAGVAAGVRGADVPVLALALVTGAVCLVPTLLDIGRPSPRRHLLLSLLALGWAVYFVASVFTTYFLAEVILEDHTFGILDLKMIRPADIVRGQLGALIGLLMAFVGYAIPLSRMFPQGIPRPRREWSYRSALFVAAVMVPLGWSLHAAATVGVLPKRLGSGFLGAISNSTYLALALLMLTYIRYRKREPLLLMAALLPPSMIFNFLGGAKSAFLAPAAAVAIAYVIAKRQIALRWIAAGFLAVIVIYPVAEYQRRVILRNNTLGTAYVLQRPVEVFTRLANFLGSQGPGRYLLTGAQATSKRLDALGVTSVIMRDCPSRVPYQGGWTLGYIVLSYVPRVVWADKPEMTIGQWVTDAFVAPGVGLKSHTGPSWIGELYFNFGWIGIVLGMLVVGVWVRIVHEMFFRAGAPLPAQIMSVVALFTMPPAVQSSLMTPVNGVILGSIPLIVTHWAIRLTGGAPASARPDEARPGDAPELSPEARSVA